MNCTILAALLNLEEAAVIPAALKLPPLLSVRSDTIASNLRLISTLFDVEAHPRADHSVGAEPVGSMSRSGIVVGRRGIRSEGCWRNCANSPSHTRIGSW